ncbi:MAG: cell envelope integrity protein TolA [Methylococcaceae bacterium]|jgi:TonB family protein|nr:cell envelope integrity protein TolA [Methylococcaceae bacterium]MDZ4157851.1 cell envelope integrity protein TolA [Methylococcales bacterium]MDP2392356.1 cell envelope integrity protein TolA [Methylococcaceae bacterium]MDP3021250.1 cell envelope integrity protein TolA [Methylococcaceae bacterium]MDP3389800.1 cell envelope integrity protein TolA [Methylococcaceae bacterium]
MKKNYSWLRRLPVLLGIAFSLLIVLGVWFLKDNFHKPPQTKKVVQQITMIQPPPPPPPPPEIKQPEPEIKEEKIEEPTPDKEPEPAPEEANEPPAAELGLDANGTAGSDGFGLAARKGGRSILGGTPGSSILWYGGQIKRQVEDNLQNLLNDTPAMKNGYSVIVNVWVGPDGRITRGELASGSGKADVDQAIRTALPKLRASIGKAPPDNMPQPVKIRLTSRV